MKKQTVNFFSTPRGRLAASLLVGGAVGFFGVAAHAQTQAPAPAASAAASQVAPPLAMTKPSAGPSAASLGLPTVQAFETAPSLRASPLALGASDVKTGSATGAAALNALGQSTQDAGVPWVLASDAHPWALGYHQPNPLNTLYFNLPTEKEVRIMLPGASADVTDRARLTVSRYITDNIGAAAQVRGRQLETFNQWAENTSRQKLTLPKDPWAAYQFYRESSSGVAAFKDKVSAQTEPALAQMANDIRSAVENLSGVMNAAGGYDQKLQWYNVLVQLKEGITLYQIRVTEADKLILDAIAGYEQNNPPVARPAGSPPPQKNIDGVNIPEAKTTPALGGGLTSEPVAREKAKPPVASESSSQMGGLIVLLGMGLVVFGLFMKLRRKVADKAPKDGA